MTGFSSGSNHPRAEILLPDILNKHRAERVPDKVGDDICKLHAHVDK